MKSKKNKSEIIREHLLSLPASRRSPTAVAKALNAKGHGVTRNLVSVVKTMMSKNNPDAMGRNLVIAKKFLDRVGGPAEAQRLISILNRIMD